MPITNFIKNLENLNTAIDNIISKKIDISNKPKEDMLDFKDRKKLYYIDSLKSALKGVKSSYVDLNQLVNYDLSNQKIISEIIELVSKISSDDLTQLKKDAVKIFSLTAELNVPDKERGQIIKIPKNIPAAIRHSVSADLKEIEKCYNAECYRSAAILCGRVLEAALHRKYYEATGYDVLEKNPGIGLGTLIAKLSEKNVKFEPGLTQQIHLVNQLRIFSVHIKQETFYPSKAQTQAMILYTLDILEKLFVK